MILYFIMVILQSKSGKELVSFLTNDFLLFVQPIKFSLNCQQFSFERNEHQKFKMYRKVYNSGILRILKIFKKIIKILIHINHFFRIYNVIKNDISL